MELTVSIIILYVNNSPLLCFIGGMSFQGYFMRPTIITGLKDNSRCMQEEIFGPVTCVTPFDTEEEVISRANDTQYGLCASVFTSNLARGHRVAHKLKVIKVYFSVNLLIFLDNGNLIVTICQIEQRLFKCVVFNRLELYGQTVG